jgi:hypothetical protein
MAAAGTTASEDARARAIARLKAKRGFQYTAATFVLVWLLLVAIWALS